MNIANEKLVNIIKQHIPSLVVKIEGNSFSISAKNKVVCNGTASPLEIENHVHILLGGVLIGVNCK